jgi:hypothetical protein
VAQNEERYKKRIVVSHEGHFYGPLGILPPPSPLTPPPPLFNPDITLSRKKQLSFQDLEASVVLLALHLGSDR